jgi:GT2 family glycosyltransferase
MTKKNVNKFKLSIITVNWNGLDYLKKLVYSVEKYTKDYELIIVDNASADGSIEFIKSTKHKGVFLKKNTGWVGGINEGLKKTNGEYICFINNDIEVTENWFDGMVKHFNDPDNNKIGMIGCTTNFTMGLQRHDFNQHFNGNHHIVNYLVGWLMLTKRTVLEEVAKQDYDKKLTPINGMAGLDTVFGLGSSDDLDISLRIRKAGYNLVIARDVFVYHHGSKSFEKKFGKDILKLGTEDNKKYFDDVNQKLDILRKKWGENEIAEMLKVEIPKAKFRGTIGVPHGDYIPHRFHTDLMNLSGLENVKINHVYGSLVQKARNDIAKAMDGDWLVFIDSDMVFAPDSVTRLVRHLEREDVDIVSAACFRKVPKYEPCFFWRLPNETVKYYRKLDWPRDNLFEVDAVGSAFIAIKRKVFETIPFPWYEYNMPLSEDLNFCRIAKNYGFRIWIDPTIKIGHLALLPIDEDVFTGYNKDEIAKWKEDRDTFGEDPSLVAYNKALNK